MFRQVRAHAAPSAQKLSKNCLTYLPQLAKLRDMAQQAFNGAALRALREAYGWRGSKFATACSISHGYLVNIEKGVRSPNVELVRRFATVLGVPLAALTSNHPAEDVA